MSLNTRTPTHTLETSEEVGVHFLHFGSEWVQGAMRIARPFSLELEYTREMAACLLLRPDADWPKRVLQIGLGAASLEFKGPTHIFLRFSPSLPFQPLLP